MDCQFTRGEKHGKYICVCEQIVCVKERNTFSSNNKTLFLYIFNFKLGYWNTFLEVLQNLLELKILTAVTYEATTVHFLLLKNCWILKIIDQKESMSEKSATRGRNKPRRIKVFLPDIICLSSCYTEWGTSLPSKKHRHLDFSGLLPENKTESNPGTKKSCETWC